MTARSSKAFKISLSGKLGASASVTASHDDASDSEDQRPVIPSPDSSEAESDSASQSGASLQLEGDADEDQHQDAHEHAQQKQKSVTGTSSYENPWLVALGSDTIQHQKEKVSKHQKHARKLQAALEKKQQQAQLPGDNAGGMIEGENSNDQVALRVTELSDDEQDLPDAEQRQRDLVARAFAGDDALEAEFKRAKKAEIDAGIREEDLGQKELPGWGSWSGVKESKTREKRRIKQRKAVFREAAAKRADAKMDKVIMAENRDKKFLKYSVDKVPFPFTSREQYERAMRQPLGPEWNSRMAHATLTHPKVVVKPGHLIAPLQASAIAVEKSKQTSKGGKKFPVGAKKRPALKHGKKGSL